MDVISFMLVVWMLKVLAEDAWSTVKGAPNPRIDRRKARQKARGNNRVWGAFVDWLGDVAEDARAEAAEARQRRRERKADQQDEVIDAEIVEDEDIEDEEPVRRHEDLSAEECRIPGCPVHDRRPKPEPKPEQPKTNVYQFPNRTQEEKTMGTNTEVTGLDQAIGYARSIAGEANNHASAGNEGYIGHLTQRNVTGQALQSAYDMQAAFSAAAAAAETHASELEKQRVVQEAFDQNADAGDQQFAQGGR